MSGGVPAGEAVRATVRLSELYPKLRVPVPEKNEWLDFFIIQKKSRHSLYWRINDGSRENPDTVEFGFISSHKVLRHAQFKAAWLVREQRTLGLAT